MLEPKRQDCDLAVIGAGMAGMAAALFAANRGISVVQVGGSGGILFATGFLDLLGVHPVEELKSWPDPWAGIEALRKALPKHPYARMETREINAALDEFLSLLEAAGLPYSTTGDRNVRALTPLGTVKPTYSVPQTMWNGVIALEDKRPCLLVDFQGLKEFNGTQILEVLRDSWPDLRSARISFPGTEHMSRVYTRHMAQNLELSEYRERLAQRVRPLVKDAQVVGMPAIFGITRTREIVSKFQEEIGAPLFEIPTLPASVPGFRLKEAFEAMLPARGVRTLYQSMVLEVLGGQDEDFILRIGNQTPNEEVRAKGVILASGRFFGKGLVADRQRIRETIFDLPVLQPESRSSWHSRDLLDPRGHSVNQAGIETDDLFRPLDRNGHPAYPSLFASGSILAHQDWMRMKCGSGLAIATSYAAVKAFCENN